MNVRFQFPNYLTDILLTCGFSLFILWPGFLGYEAIQEAKYNSFLLLFGGYLALMLLFALILNMGAPGIPGGGIVLGATYLGMLGVENAALFLGMYAGIYRLLDMAYTSLNVAGDVTANVLIDRMEKKR